LSGAVKSFLIYVIRLVDFPAPRIVCAGRIRFARDARVSINRRLHDANSLWMKLKEKECRKGLS